MKNKKSNKILLPLVCLIWIGVLGQFLGWWDAEHTEKTVLQTENIPHSSTAKQEAPLELDLSYIDPFLGKSFASPKTHSAPKRKTRINLIKVPNKVLLKVPQLRYQGLVEGRAGQRKTAILQINKKTYTVQSGDSLQGLHIQKISTEKLSIQIADSLIHVYP